ncbi:ABC transporter permease [Nocardia rhizosphaerae]|uniref:ABC transporter permease n=1 Tax=Nocardia rhizosphaerae TaxID=1691571 RepID=A0ABV8LCT5_9NOCA
MTAITAAPGLLARAHTASEFAGTGQMLRLSLRRDRVIAPLWSLAIGLMPALQIVSIKDLYATQQQLDTFAATTASSPALLAMYGPVFGSSLGSIGTWKAGAMYAMIAIAAVLTVIRHTRVEEETGRAELVGATSIGRFAGLTGTLLLTFGAATVAGIACTASLLATGLPVAGSVAWGVSLAMSAIVWGALAAVAAQVSTGARIARGLALGALGAAFAVRAVGDAGNGVLSWFSPLGWSLQIRPFAEERWWVLLPLVALAAGATLLAYQLLRTRDIGAGLLAERPGPAMAGGSLAGPVGLAWRLQRGSMLAWTVGFALYGLLIGGSISSIGGMLEGSDNLRDIMASLGGSADLEKSFIAYAIMMLAAAASAYSISSVLRLHEEENTGRAETVLAAAVGRVTYTTSHLLFALLAPAVALLVAGVGIGLVWGAGDGDIGGRLGESMAAVTVQLPAVWVVTAIAVLLFGVLPKYASVAWAVLSTMIGIELLGAFGTFPQWVMDLVPFVHPPKLPGGTFALTPLLWLLVVAVAGLAVGLAAFRRRDLR